MAKFGIKEVLNVVFIDKKTNKPALYFDTLKVSNIEMTSESTTATGGQGNATLMQWSYGRSATMTITDALLSMKSLGALAGTAVSTEAKKIYDRLYSTAVKTTIELPETPIKDSITLFKIEDGEEVEEITAFSSTGKTITLTTALTTAQDVVAYYEYELAEGKSQTVEFSASKFPSAYKVVGFGIIQNQNGLQEKVKLVIDTAQLKTDHTITFDAENVSTFDFNLEITASGDAKKLYEIIRF